MVSLEEIQKAVSAHIRHSFSSEFSQEFLINWAGSCLVLYRKQKLCFCSWNVNPWKYCMYIHTVHNGPVHSCGCSSIVSSACVTPRNDIKCTFQTSSRDKQYTPIHWPVCCSALITHWYFPKWVLPGSLLFKFKHRHCNWSPARITMSDMRLPFGGL